MARSCAFIYPNVPRSGRVRLGDGQLAVAVAARLLGLCLHGVSLHLGRQRCVPHRRELTRVVGRGDRRRGSRRRRPARPCTRSPLARRRRDRGHIRAARAAAGPSSTTRHMGCGVRRAGRGPGGRGRSPPCAPPLGSGGLSWCRARTRRRPFRGRSSPLGTRRRGPGPWRRSAHRATCSAGTATTRWGLRSTTPSLPAGRPRRCGAATALADSRWAFLARPISRCVRGLVATASGGRPLTPTHAHRAPVSTTLLRTETRRAPRRRRAGACRRGTVCCPGSGRPQRLPRRPRGGACAGGLRAPPTYRGRAPIPVRGRWAFGPARRAVTPTHSPPATQWSSRRRSPAWRRGRYGTCRRLGAPSGARDGRGA